METFRFSLKESVPLFPSYLFMGIAAGVLLSGAGYYPVWAFLSGGLIYAGSMQIVMTTLMISGVPLATIALMTFFVNARHIFYGIGLLERFKKQGIRGIYMALILTDATFSVITGLKCPDGVDQDKADFYISLINHFIWTFSCTVGAVFGNLIPFDTAGIEFCSPAFFMVIVINQWKEAKSHVPAIMGFVSAVVFWFIFGPENFILPALCVTTLLLVMAKDKIRLDEKQEV